MFSEGILVLGNNIFLTEFENIKSLNINFPVNSGYSTWLTRIIDVPIDSIESLDSK